MTPQNHWLRFRQEVLDPVGLEPGTLRFAENCFFGAAASLIWDLVQASDRGELPEVLAGMAAAIEEYQEVADKRSAAAFERLRAKGV